MKKITYKILFLSFFLILPLKANENIYFIDLDQIIEKTNKGIELIDNLKKLNQESLDKIKLKENELRSKENLIISSKNVVDESVFKEKINLFKKDVNDFYLIKNEINNEFENQKKKKINNYFSTINPIIQDYMKKNSITILIEKKNIFIGNSNYDITSAIIEIINKN